MARFWLNRKVRFFFAKFVNENEVRVFLLATTHTHVRSTQFKKNKLRIEKQIS
jgi:hypothetical protein